MMAAVARRMMWLSALVRGGVMAVLSVTLIAASVESADGPVFCYGEIVDVNPGSRVVTVRRDDKSKSRFKVTSVTEIQKHLDRPVPAGFEDLRLGARVRVLVGWTSTTNPTIREAPTIFVYE
jgi:hypothetical protein